MQELQANVHKIVEDRIQVHVRHIEKQAAVKRDRLQRTMATTFEQRYGGLEQVVGGAHQCIFDCQSNRNRSRTTIHEGISGKARANYNSTLEGSSDLNRRFGSDDSTSI